MKKIKIASQNPERPKIGQDANKQLPSLAKQKPAVPGKKPGRKRKFAILVIVISLVLAAAASFLYWRWDKQLKNSATSGGGKVANSCTNILDPKCWTQAFKPQLDQVNGKTNVLIVGVDTRESGSGSGLMNTDTIILVTLDHQSKKTRMISFPRDLYAPYGCKPENLPYKTKINAIYAYGKFNCPEKDGMKTLTATVEKVTGEKVQYTGLIRLEGVVEAVDAIGGITLDVPETFVDAYPYIELSPRLQKTCVRSRSLPAYCEFKFSKGPQQMDGETALIYSRMRQYSSDFVRADRQQQVISAIKDKILSDETSTADKAKNLFNIYQKMGKKVEVDLNLEMILAGLALANDVDTNPIKVVLDPKFGGGGLIVNGEGSNYNFKDYTFKQVQSKLAFINANADIYREEPKIYAVNQTATAWTKENPIIQYKNEGKWFVEIVTDTKAKQADKTGIVIVDFSEGGKANTVKDLEQRFADYNVVTKKASEDTTYVKSRIGEDVAVYIYDLTAKAPTTTTDEAKP